MTNVAGAQANPWENEGGPEVRKHPEAVTPNQCEWRGVGFMVAPEFMQYSEEAQDAAEEAADRLAEAATVWMGNPQIAVELAYRAVERTSGLDPNRAAPPKPKRKYSAREVWDRDGWTCQECGTHKGLTVDHIYPQSKGGGDELENLQTLCGPCNSRKGARV